ncbi:helix-turn-helix transcriptional regulator [Pseudomonas cannabina]|uniref:helix-turn-helix transcriptional regulator n=2 Tax=Pseudomonas cannabina TaxID=86840 RepID=UPI000ABAD44B|nr:sigma factor-like helix-turn-helix DNA-binding protein [Pseudomonas cannabina]KAA8698847.1 hypothetical protein F4W70_27435 [Pseudomonas cannabina]
MAIFLEGQEEWTTDLLPELSPQEGKAVIMYSHGFSLRTIAIEVGISPHTVRVYLSRAKDKFEIHNLFELRDICMLREALIYSIFRPCNALEALIYLGGNSWVLE